MLYHSETGHAACLFDTQRDILCFWTYILWLPVVDGHTASFLPVSHLIKNRQTTKAIKVPSAKIQRRCVGSNSCWNLKCCASECFEGTGCTRTNQRPQEKVLHVCKYIIVISILTIYFFFSTPMDEMYFIIHPSSGLCGKRKTIPLSGDSVSTFVHLYRHVIYCK